MLADSPILGLGAGLDLFRWETGVAVLAGLLLTCLVVIAGLSPHFRQRTRSAPAGVSLFGAIRDFLAERRQALRQKCDGIRVDIASAETRTSLCEGEVLDRSLRGLSLAVPQAFAPGIVLRVYRIGDRASSPRVLVEVKYCRPLPDHRWMLGCEIVQPQAGGTGLLFA